MDMINPTSGRICLVVCVAILVSIAIVWGWDSYRAINRLGRQRPEPCDEDKNLDRLALEVDRHLDDRARRRGRTTPITDPTLDPVQTLGLNGRRAGFGGGWPT